MISPHAARMHTSKLKGKKRETIGSKTTGNFLSWNCIENWSETDIWHGCQGLTKSCNWAGLVIWCFGNRYLSSVRRFKHATDKTPKLMWIATTQPGEREVMIKLRTIFTTSININLAYTAMHPLLLSTKNIIFRQFHQEYITSRRF